MNLRLTTWNVNGIRNPFGYQPWRDKKTFEAMFDLLEADVVVLQETKIQRKDLRDDMVLVPGFDCYWSLPKHKKGYSGVVIYTRNEKCAPIRAEEGITGILTPPNSTTSFRDLPEDGQIGGYPTGRQLSQSDIDITLLDAEGRCVILEFPAFVLIGTYCPAERDETRTHFRTAFLRILDARIRNLVKMGKRVIWTGDLNISRAPIDTAAAEEMMRKNDMDVSEWISTPARRLFNQLLVGGTVHGERDEGRETAIMWDVCRAFHEGRKGMYTCWETKVNARPGNFGARIDYVVCSHDMKEWFRDANIQEGLMGSDHCPVYATISGRVDVDGVDTSIYDMMNPTGMFEDGVRKQPWTPKCMLPMSGKLIPEFDRRRNIKDMFARKPSVAKTPSNINGPATFMPPKSPVSISAVKRPFVADPPLITKRTKSSNDSGVNSKGQQSLKGFFKAKVPVSEVVAEEQNDSGNSMTESISETLSSQEKDWIEAEAAVMASQQSWGKLFSRPRAPKCEHDEPCKTMLTKKPGVNCGRSFWMCNRPLGPSGNKEKGTQWRCSTFIWSTDWDARTDTG